MPDLTVETEGHWGGRSPESHCGRLTVGAGSMSDAALLGPVGEALARHGREALESLAEAARALLAEAGSRGRDRRPRARPEFADSFGA